MISVIVPVYNAEKYLDKCVASIVNQTYKDLEIILVDDGSPDNCPAMCDEWAKKDNRIKVIHKENGGQATARNAGLAMATGEYIAFVDSDDTCDPKMLEILRKMMLKPDADIAICGHATVYAEDSLSEPCSAESESNQEYLSPKKLWDEVFGQLNNAVWNKLYRADLLQGINFPQTIGHGEDLIFNLKYLKKCSGGIIDNTPLYHYFKRKDSVTGSSFTERKFHEIESKDIALDIVEHDAPEQLENAKKYCFRARMNVLRAIYSAQKENEYPEQVAACKAYVSKNYTTVKKNLRNKERIEYLLLSFCEPIYKTTVKKMKELL